MASTTTPARAAHATAARRPADAAHPAAAARPADPTRPLRSDLDALLTRFGEFDGVEVAFAATVPGDGTFILDRFRGARTDALRDVTVPVGDGMGGRCIKLARPVTVVDYGVARGITHPVDDQVAREGLRSVFAIPMIIGGRVRSVLYGAARRPVRYGDRLIQRAAEIVRSAVPETAEPETLLTAVRDPSELHAELRSIAAEISDVELRARLLAVERELIGSPAASAAAVALSPRELDVLCIAAVGAGNAEISRRLNLAEQTVKSYLRSAMYKLDSHSRGEAVHRARAAGLLH